MRDDCEHLDITTLSEGAWECNDCGQELGLDDLPEQYGEASSYVAESTGEECPDCYEMTYYSTRDDTEYCSACGWEE